MENIIIKEIPAISSSYNLMTQHSQLSLPTVLHNAWSLFLDGNHSVIDNSDIIRRAANHER